MTVLFQRGPDCLARYRMAGFGRPDESVMAEIHEISEFAEIL